MQVTALVDFHDNLKDIDRKRGERFVVTRERFEEMRAKGEEIGVTFVEEAPSASVPAKESPESRAAKAPAKRRAAKKE